MASSACQRVKLAVSGVDCPNCAAQLEQAISRVPGVQGANLDFAAGILHLVASGDTAATLEATLEAVYAAAARVEPDARFALTETTPKNVRAGSVEHHTESAHEHHHSEEAPAWIRLAVGSALYAAALLWPGKASILYFLPGYLVLGGKTVWRALRNLGHGQIFDENFLMSLATIGAFAIGQYPEAVAVMLFYEIGELLQSLAVGHARHSIKELVDLRPDYANVTDVDGNVQRVEPNLVHPGAQIVVQPGERVPLDGTVVEGVSLVDTAALTGEPVPRQVRAGETVLAGYVNKSALLRVQVTKEYGDSAIARVLELVESAGARKAATERFITRFSRYYTPTVVFSALALALLPPLLTSAPDWRTWTYRALVFLVVSCPCALVVSVPIGFFGGIGGAARKGILVKGAHFLERMHRIHTMVFDKTGTLTKGVFRVVAVQPTPGVDQADLLRLAAAAEQFSTHPIAVSIRQAAGSASRSTASAYREVAGEGVVCCVDGREVAVGNHRLMERMALTAPAVCAGGTVVHVAADHAYLGHLIIADELKDDVQAAIRQLRRCGVQQIVMLTGDRQTVADSIASTLGLDAVYAELLPDDKVRALEQLTCTGGSLVYVGDGINDAPVLARADVGVAMGALGSDAAIEAADVVLMTDELMRLPAAVAVARHTKAIIWQNIGLALGVKGLVLALGGAGVASLWEAVFADVGVTLLAVLNSLRVLTIPETVPIPAKDGRSGSL